MTDELRELAGDDVAASESVPDASSDAAPDAVSEPESPPESESPPAAPAAIRRPLRRRIVTTAIVLAVLGAVGGAFWAWSAAAETRYEAEATSLDQQLAAQNTAARTFDVWVYSSQSVATRIHSVVGTPAFTTDGLAEAATLSQSLGALDAAAAATPVDPPLAANADSPSTTAPDPGAAPGYRPPWQLMSDADQLEARAATAQQATADLTTAQQNTEAAEDTAKAADVTYFAAMAKHADDTIAGNSLSNRSLQVSLTRMAKEARDSGMSSSRDGSFLASMTDAEAQIRASQATNQAHLDDPAWATRDKIESYARSLSNGVALEFVWAPEVSGLGAGWLSGTAQTFDTDGTYAIIRLNYTVEDAWYEGRDARALVTHEVGHTQMYRCWAQYSGPSFNKNDETWATAWSISYGFDIPGSGIEAYGRPTDEQIAVAGQCH